jgi:hypothetical protein
MRDEFLETDRLKRNLTRRAAGRSKTHPSRKTFEADSEISLLWSKVP